MPLETLPDGLGWPVFRRRAIMPKTDDLGSRSAALTDTFESSEYLDAARELFAKQGDALALPPIPAALHAAGIVGSVTVSPSTKATEYLAAARHDLPFESPVELGLPIASAPAMRSTVEAGPFRGASGLFRLRLYGPAQGYSIYASG